MLNSDAAVLAWAEKQGIDKTKFEQAYKSFGVATKAKRALVGTLVTLALVAAVIPWQRLVAKWTQG